MLTITIDRTALSLANLVITGARATTTSGFWIPAGGFEPPSFTPRRLYAPDSAYVAGRQLLAAVLDQGNLPLTIRSKATDAAALNTQRTVLEQALSQFYFPITITLDGAAKTYGADMSWPQWAPREPWMSSDFTDRASVVIPVNPT